MLSEEEQFVLNNYRAIKLLGEGRFGTTFQVEKLTTRLNYVIKVVKWESSPSILNKMGKVAEYKNNYLVPIVEYFEFENKLCIVTEYETGGTLQGLITNRKHENRPLTERQIIKISQHMLLSLIGLHNKGVAHQDMKPENIFLGQNFHIKLGDYLLSSLLCPQKIDGDPFCDYEAPEISKAFQEGNLKVDVWSVGTIMFELLTLQKAFSSSNLNIHGRYDQELLKNSCSPQLFILITKCLSSNSIDRPDVYQLQEELNEMWTETENRVKKSNSDNSSSPPTEKISPCRDMQSIGSNYEHGKDGGTHINKEPPVILKSCLIKNKGGRKEHKRTSPISEKGAKRGRKDALGSNIRSGGRHKVTFLDQIKAQPLAQVHLVTSFKKYNADVSQKCSCCSII